MVDLNALVQLDGLDADVRERGALCRKFEADGDQVEEVRVDVEDVKLDEDRPRVLVEPVVARQVVKQLHCKRHVLSEVCHVTTPRKPGPFRPERLAWKQVFG